MTERHRYIAASIFLVGLTLYFLITGEVIAPSRSGPVEMVSRAADASRYWFSLSFYPILALLVLFFAYWRTE